MQENLSMQIECLPDIPEVTEQDVEVKSHSRNSVPGYFPLTS